MASKTLPDGRKVLVGSKADPDSSRYTPKTTTTAPRTPSIYDTLEQVKTRANELIGQRDTPTAPETPNYSPRYTTQITEPSVAQPKSAEQIQKEMMRSAQGEINALRDYENTLLSEQRVINEKNDRSTSSINTLTGLAGSTEANVQQQATTAVGQKANQAIQREVNLKLQTLLGNIRQSAVTEARAQREEARLDEETRIKNRAARQEEAASQLTNLAAGGVTYEGLKSGDPESFAYLASQFGGEEALRGAFVLNTPQESILDKKLVGSTYVISKQNPLTGKITVETVDIPGLPPDYSSSVDLGDRIMFFDPSDPQGKQFFMSKGMTPSQAASSAGNGGGGSAGGYESDLDAIIGATLSTIPTKFGQATFQSQLNKARNDSDKLNLVAAQVLKGQPSEVRTDFANQAVGINEIDKALKLLSDGTQTGFLNDKAQYAFNVVGKDYDPKLAKLSAHITAAIQPYRNSVTGAAWGTQEETEYQQLFGSTKYSPAELRSRLTTLKDVLKSKSAVGLNTFVNPMGFYDNAFETGAYAPSGSRVLIDKQGQALDASELTDEEYQQAIADGYTPQ